MHQGLKFFLRTWLIALLLPVTAAYCSSIASITPNNGAISGGTRIIICGFGLTGTTGVTFGGVAGTAFVLNSDTKITVSSPASNLAGPVTLALTGANPLSIANGFSYIDTGLGVAIGAFVSNRGQPVVIVSSTPTDGSEIDVANPSITITFSEDMDTSKTDISKFLLPAGMTITGIVWQNARTLTITYTGALSDFGAKRVEIADNYLASTGGNPLAIESGFAFCYDNQPPTITVNPTFTPNNPAAGDTLTFSTSATDPEGDPISYTWDFGDGTVGSGPTVNHVFPTTSDAYLVLLTVQDSHGATTTVPMLVKLAQGQVIGGGANPTQNTLIVTQAKMMLSFVQAKKQSKKPRPGRDKIQMSAVIELPPNFNPGGQTVTVAAGPVSATFKLDGKGNSKTGGNQFRLQRKLVKGQFLGGAVRIQFMIKGSFAQACTAIGFANATTPKAGITVPILTTLIMNNQQYTAQVPIVWFCKANKTGRGSRTTIVH